MLASFGDPIRFDEKGVNEEFANLFSHCKLLRICTVSGSAHALSSSQKSITSAANKLLVVQKNDEARLALCRVLLYCRAIHPRDPDFLRDPDRID